jgi:hypothetical protein
MGHEALPWLAKRSYSQTRGRTAVFPSKGRSMSPSKVKRTTLRRRPVKGAAAQVEMALKAAEMVAESKPSASYAQLQVNTATPTIVDKAMAERIAASHAGQPPPSKRFIFKGDVLEHIPLTFSHTPHAQRNLHIRGD